MAIFDFTRLKIRGKEFEILRDDVGDVICGAYPRNDFSIATCARLYLGPSATYFQRMQREGRTAHVWRSRALQRAALIFATTIDDACYWKIAVYDERTPDPDVPLSPEFYGAS